MATISPSSTSPGVRPPPGTCGPFHAYAMLHGRIKHETPGAETRYTEFTHPITKLPCTLGRALTGKKRKAHADIELGEGCAAAKCLSKKHCRIDFNADAGGFELTVLGKNGVTIDQHKFVPPAEAPGGGPGAAVAHPLGHRAAVRIGPCQMFFLLPVFKRPAREMSALIDDAFDDIGEDTLTITELADHIMTRHNFYAQKYCGKKGLTNIKQVIRFALKKSAGKPGASWAYTSETGGRWRRSARVAPAPPSPQHVGPPPVPVPMAAAGAAAPPAGVALEPAAAPSTAATEAGALAAAAAAFSVDVAAAAAPSSVLAPATNQMGFSAD